MKIPMRHQPLINIINNSLIDLPSPSNISYWWNMGSMLGLALGIQIVTGIFLAMHYCPNIELAFNSINHICFNVNYGWVMRSLHANGASLFFLCLYLHIGRGIYYKSYMLNHTWMIGTTIFIITMATAFLGYVLPWGQMSFWGATVITNLVSAIPYIGNMMVQWLWGGFAIDNATLNRFFTLHFILPFIIIAMVIIHLFFLHQNGSSNPLGTNSNLDKIPFHNYYSLKDLLGFSISMTMLLIILMNMPYQLSDPDNFTPANPLITPIHIQPEWYFLFAYAILRSIPNKLGGVIALFMSIMILYLLPLYKNNYQSSMLFPLNKILFWNLSITVILLTWIGARPVEFPYIFIGQILTINYFSIFLIYPFLMNFSIKKLFDY